MRRIGRMQEQLQPQTAAATSNANRDPELATATAAFGVRGVESLVGETPQKSSECVSWIVGWCGDDSASWSCSWCCSWSCRCPSIRPIRRIRVQSSLLDLSAEPPNAVPERSTRTQYPNALPHAVPESSSLVVPPRPQEPEQRSTRQDQRASRQPCLLYTS